MVTQAGPTWEHHAAGYEQIDFPVLPDESGVYYIYGIDPYDAVLIDKQGRLVTKYSPFDISQVDDLSRRIRELYAE